MGELRRVQVLQRTWCVFFSLILSFFFATSTVYVLQVPGKNIICEPSLIAKYEFLVVCALYKIENLVIESLLNFFFKTLMSAVWESTNVIQMLNVTIPLDPTTANVTKDFQEMAKRAQVSVEYFPSAILLKSHTTLRSQHKKVCIWVLFFNFCPLVHAPFIL